MAEHRDETITPPQTGARPQRRITPPPTPTRPATSGASVPRQIAIAARVLIAIAGAISLFLIARETSDTISRAMSLNASAIQLIEVYTEGLFWMVFTVGMMIAGYIATRSAP